MTGVKFAKSITGLLVNIPNYASAVVSADEVVDAALAGQ
jgi:hypothetical protein